MDILDSSLSGTVHIKHHRHHHHRDRDDRDNDDNLIFSIIDKIEDALE